MRITSTGHAGLLVETRAGRILCDPWFNPAFYGSWFPFPDNSDQDPAVLGAAEYLYVSHLHRDHFDPEWLSRYMNKGATVLLPDYPVPDLRQALEDLGFRSFVQTRNDEPVELGSGLRILISTVASPADGELGDSVLAVDDGVARILNQNDARPVDATALKEFGPYDAHFLQYSGALWWPVVYEFADHVRSALARRKRNNGLERAMNYMEEYGAAHVFPCAGPPCFLDDDLFGLNDVDNHPDSTFPDQLVFLDFLRSAGRDNAHLFLPGTAVEFEGGGRCRVEQISQAAVDDVFLDKKDYLQRYQERVRPVITAERASWPQVATDLQGQLAVWLEPLMADADRLCRGVNGRVMIDVLPDPDRPESLPGERIVLDFLDRRIVHWSGQECRYTFRIARRLVEDLVQKREQDWVNHLFLSCRFSAARNGQYNEYIFSFLQSMSPARLAYMERYFAEQEAVGGLARAGEYVIQRTCPHLGADLARFGVVNRRTLTCQIHGWEFDIVTGECLTSSDRRLHTEHRPVEADDGLPPVTVALDPQGEAPRSRDAKDQAAS